jgi:hypothetical protein
MADVARETPMKTTRSDDVQPCPVPGCGGVAKIGHLMCRLCWGLVPRALQLEVHRAWRALRFIGARDGKTGQLRVMRSTYEGVRARAIQAAVDRR